MADEKRDGDAPVDPGDALRDKEGQSAAEAPADRLEGVARDKEGDAAVATDIAAGERNDAVRSEEDKAPAAEVEKEPLPPREAEAEAAAGKPDVFPATGDDKHDDRPKKEDPEPHMDTTVGDRDINAGAVLKFGVSLAALLLGTAAAVALMIAHWKSDLKELDPPPSPLAEANAPVVPPDPRLQESPPRDMRMMNAHLDAILNSYGWVDKGSGFGRIPIKRAMELTAQKGIAPRSGGTPAAGGTATPAAGGTPAPGGTATPAAGETPAAGGTATPAAGETPAPGGTATPATGGTATPATGGAAPKGGAEAPKGGAKAPKGGAEAPKSGDAP